ncbi:MAG TPA: TonB-dependent receptor [Bryobacteraceae bacterium]|nr:TonB-dependent receptor [Bryobacteraceae bacterium]
MLITVPLSLLGQQSAANINGIITDPSGAVVEGATITLTDVTTGGARSTVSNATGNYAFVDVKPAPYTMKVTKAGFNTVSQPEFTMQVNQTATLNFTLTVGSTQQSVTVDAAAVAIEASTAELGTVINQTAVNDLPLNGRNFTQLLTLTPGASPVSVGQNSGGGGGFAGNAIGSFSFPALNGQRNRSNMFLLDGINDQGSFIGNYNFEPIVDTVQEFKVQSHNDEASFGQAVGGIVNVVTKSGTNNFHGSLWEFLRNSDLDARNFFIAKVNPLRQNQFGIAGGGPVWIPKVYNGKNRTFFYGGYEGFRQSQASQDLLLTPTTAQLNGDFSAIKSQLYNPFSTRTDPAHPGNYIRDPFPNNQIPQNLLNPASLLYAKTLFPAAGSLTASGTNAFDLTPSRVNQDSYNGRVDQVFSERDVLFGRISYYNQNDSNSAGYPGVVNQIALEGWNWTLHETHTFNPTAVLDVHFGRNWGDDLTEKVFSRAPSGFATQLEQLGFSPNYIGGFQGGQGPFVPLVSISGYVSTGGNNVQDTRIADIWEFGGDFTKIAGRHNLKIGANFATNNTRSPIYGVQNSFAATQTQNPESSANTGDSLASFLLGVPDSANKRNVLETEHGGWVNGVYFQDQWKLTDKLTINYGLRWDVTLWPIYGTPNTPDQYVGDLNLNNGTYILAAVPPACSSTVGFPCIPGGTLPAHVTVTDLDNHAIYHNDYRDWQGRAGLAYRLTNKTALRAGYGRFYDNWNAVIQLAQNYEGAWPDVGQLIANNLNQQGVTASAGDPFNLGSSGVVYPAPNPFNQVNWFIDPTSYRMPYSDQWNVGVEQQLGQNTVLSLAYVGAHDLQLNLGGYRNTAVTPGPGDKATVASRQPYPYITPTFYDQSIGQSKYNAFQFRIQQRTTKGLSYLVSYTRSKSMDVGCSGSFGAEGCSVQQPYNLNADRSVSGFDLPNVFSGSWTYEIPFGKGKTFSSGNRFVNYALGNWSVNGIVSFYSGVPFNVNVSNGNISNTGNTVERANLILPNPYAANRGPNQWLNPSAFATPPPYTYGTLGRNALRTESTKNLDLSIFRRFPVTESAGFEFRAESFNLTNTPIFGTPNSTLGNPNFGIITSTRNTPRELQFALKFEF